MCKLGQSTLRLYNQKKINEETITSAWFNICKFGEMQFDVASVQFQTFDPIFQI